jgi:hypothetical protein
MKLLTRRQIMEEWNKQSDEMLDSFCCPNCRDILHELDDRYFCKNKHCHQLGILKSKISK